MPHRRHGDRRLRRRLPGRPPGSEPRPAQARQDGRSAGRRRRVRAPRAPLRRRVDAPLVHPHRSTSTSASSVWDVWAIFIIMAATNGGEPRRRARRTGRRIGHLVFAAFVFIGVLAVPAPGRLPRAPGRALDTAIVAGGMMARHRVPVVERGARRRSSWATRARSRSAARSRASRSSANTHAAAPVVGGLYVIETLSRDRAGRRRSGASTAGCSAWRRSTTTSRSAGWPEFTVIVRFWLFAGTLRRVGLGLFYADFLRIPGVLD